MCHTSGLRNASVSQKGKKKKKSRKLESLQSKHSIRADVPSAVVLQGM